MTENQDLLKGIGARLGELLRLADVDNTTFAGYCGVTPQTVRSWIRQENTKAAAVDKIAAGMKRHPALRAGLVWVVFGEVYPQIDGAGFSGRAAADWSETVYNAKAQHLSIVRDAVKTGETSAELLDEIKKLIEKFN